MIAPARSLTQATVLAQQADFDLALIGLRLGHDTSTAVADSLLKRNMPFAFITGYSDSRMMSEHLRSIPRLIKPYAAHGIRSIIATLKERAGPRPVPGGQDPVLSESGRLDLKPARD